MQSSVDNLLALFAENIAFNGWIRLENVVDLLASSASGYNFFFSERGAVALPCHIRTRRMRTVTRL